MGINGPKSVAYLGATLAVLAAPLDNDDQANAGSTERGQISKGVAMMAANLAGWVGATKKDPCGPCQVGTGKDGQWEVTCDDGQNAIVSANGDFVVLQDKTGSAEVRVTNEQPDAENVLADGEPGGEVPADQSVTGQLRRQQAAERAAKIAKAGAGEPTVTQRIVINPGKPKTTQALQMPTTHKSAEGKAEPTVEPAAIPDTVELRVSQHSDDNKVRMFVATEKGNEAFAADVKAAVRATLIPILEATQACNAAEQK